VGLEFSVDPADIDESVLPGEDAVAYVLRVARAKCAAVAAGHPGDVVLAADTTVAVDATIVGKPGDHAEAVAMITRLAGRTHQVHTAVVVSTAGGVRDVVVTTDVTFVPLTAVDIEWYVGLGESFDKAGGYGIQSAGGALVARIEGSPTNVIGLPLPETLALLAD